MSAEVVSIDAEFLVGAFSTAVMLIIILAGLVVRILWRLFEQRFDRLDEKNESNHENIAQLYELNRDHVEKYHKE